MKVKDQTEWYQGKTLRSNAASAQESGRAERRRNGLDFLEPEPICQAELGNPDRVLQIVAASVIEIIAGVRPVEQLASHLSDEVYVRLRDRAIRAAARRAETGQKTPIPSLSVGKMTIVVPAEGVVESVVLVRFPERTRAIAIRLEGINRSWRATAISVI